MARHSRGSTHRALGSLLGDLGKLRGWKLRQVFRDYYRPLYQIRVTGVPAPFLLGFLAIFAVVLLVAWFLAQILGFFGLFFEHRGQQLGAKDADELLRLDKRPPMLILRSFHDDVRWLSVLNRLVKFGKHQEYDGGGFYARTFEQILLDGLPDLGPPLAIGRPGERVPPLGAARRVIEDRDWKAEVERLADEAVLVILIIGRTQGLNWEVGRLFELGLAGKILVVFPPGKHPETFERWRPFRAAASRASSVDFPDILAPDAVYGMVRHGRFLVVRTGRGRSPGLEDYESLLWRFRPWLDPDSPFPEPGSQKAERLARSFNPVADTEAPAKRANARPRSSGRGLVGAPRTNLMNSGVGTAILVVGFMVLASLFYSRSRSIPAEPAPRSEEPEDVSERIDRRIQLGENDPFSRTQEETRNSDQESPVDIPGDPGE